jgi:hypothetical protein
MNLGISIKIDVTKIDKARLHQGQKGTYLDLTTFIDTEQEGQYGDHGFISQSQSKEERQNGAEKMPILGNCKVFFKKEADAPQAPPPPPPQQGFNPAPPPPPMQDRGSPEQAPQDESISDIPF